MTAAQIISALELAPHPEGGWYRQTWQSVDRANKRPMGTSIYYLLEKGQKSRWHRVDAVEVWHFYAGAPLDLFMAPAETQPASRFHLGADIANGARPQAIVPKGVWQAARSTGAWTLAGCTVTPGFEFEGFELAPPGFDIPVDPAPKS